MTWAFTDGLRVLLSEWVIGVDLRTIGGEEDRGNQYIEGGD